jgi:hypothetical protein
MCFLLLLGIEIFSQRKYFLMNAELKNEMNVIMKVDFYEIIWEILYGILLLPIKTLLRQQTYYSFLIVICRISVLINIFSARVKLELDLRYVD